MARKKYRYKGVTYRSGFELEVAKQFNGELPYEPMKVTYAIIKECEYTPDFVVKVLEEGMEKIFFVECKGRFRDRLEAEKYLHIRKSLPDNVELLFCFQKPTVPFPYAKSRKDGTKYSHGDWAEKHGFTYTTVDELENVLYTVEIGHGQNKP